MNFLKNIPVNQQSDPELIKAFQETGNIAFLSTLYQRYMDLVYGVCLKYFKDPDRSKDAVMDIFEELNTKLRQHRVENFKAWLHVLARNHCLMQLRSPRNIKTTEFNGELMQSDQIAHLPNDMLDREESYKLLEECMKKLPAQQKTSIELFFIQKKCYNEIAVITGNEWSQVRSFIQNGKRNLKICLDAGMAAQDR